MKYDTCKTVDAIYGMEEGNPYLEALPDRLTPEELYSRIAYVPGIPKNLRGRTPMERNGLLSELLKTFVPSEVDYHVYEMLYSAIRINYESYSIIDETRRMTDLYAKGVSSYQTQSYGGAILGVPGVGKSSMIRRCLRTIPQTIVHHEYKGKKLYEKQIPYIIVECPSDCSVKTLAMSIIKGIDDAAGTDYLSQISSSRALNNSSLVLRTKILTSSQHVGLLVIDEIQNVITSAAKKNQIRPLIRFLVELSNESNVSVILAGTLDADDLFAREEHLKRRTLGPRLLPYRKDAAFLEFLCTVWEYQTVLNKTELTPKTADLIYSITQGIPSYVIRLLYDAQTDAILNGKECIDYTQLNETAKKRFYNVTECHYKGVSISDYSVGNMGACENAAKEEPKKRGRTPVKRSDRDLLVIAENHKNDIMEALMSRGMVEVSGASEEKGTAKEAVS